MLNTQISISSSGRIDMFAKLNYYITIATLANLVFVTLSVWFFPRQWIFETTSTTAWILIIGQYIIAHRLHTGPSKAPNLGKLMP